MLSKNNNNKPGSEEEVVLAIARAVVYGRAADIGPAIKKGNLSWPALRDGLVYHGLAPFAYPVLKDSLELLPSAASEALRLSYYHSLAKNQYFERKLLELCAAFEKGDVLLVPIKGTALVEDLYPHLPVRPSQDIDVLIRREDLDRAIAILEGLGYEKNLKGLRESYWLNRQYHFVFTEKEPKRPSPIIELHWDLDYPDKKGMVLKERFNRLRKLAIQGRAVNALSVEDTFLELALNQRHIGYALSLRNACDTARLLNKYGQAVDWKYILKESRQSGLRSAVFFALHQASLFFGLEVTDYVRKELALPLWKKKIIRRFIARNTFSAGQLERANDVYIKSYFVLCDDLWEPIEYILNIPREQFAMFYRLKPYDRKTGFLYLNRLLYMPFRYLGNLCKLG